MTMDLSVYLVYIAIIPDSQLATSIDVPVVKSVKKLIVEYPGYFQNFFQKKKIGSSSTFMM